MYLLPSNLRLLLAASCGIVILLGMAIGTAIFVGQAELIVLSALALIAVAVGSFLILGWQMAQVLRAQGRMLDRMSGRLTIFDEKAETASPGSETIPFLGKASSVPAEEDTRTTQRNEAFNRLRDGIVHDLNNRLMVIGANVDAAARRLKDQPDLQRKLLAALVAADQAATLIARSSRFIKQRGRAVQYVDLAAEIDSIATLLNRSLLRDTVELRVNLDEGLWGIQADPNDLETAIVTLCADLRETLVQGDAITIDTQNTTVSKGTLSRSDLEGDFVRIAIGTSAGGDTAASPDKRSESAFTMQDMDLASWVEFNRGLHFLQPLGGMAEVVTMGARTVVALYIPRAKPSVQVMPLPRDEVVVADRGSGQTEILIVDDEIEVAVALQTMLEELGYVARIATSVGQALKSLKARKPRLLLSDVAMPGSTSGMTLAREVRQMLPDLPILLMTGHPVLADEEHGFPLLQKPVVSRDLHVAIQKQLSLRDGNVVSLFPKASRRMH